MHRFKYILQNVADNGEGGKTGYSSYSPEEIAARLSAPEGFFKEEDDKDGVDTKEVHPARVDNVDPDNPAQAHVASPMWDILKSDEGFVMPEGITSENEQELLRTHIAKKFGFDRGPELHPLARQVQEMAATNPNITISDIVNTVSEQYVDASRMSVDDKITFDLFARYGEYDAEKNPDGLTEEDIKEHISKMTKIEKQEAANIIERNINEYNSKLLEEYRQQNQQKYEERYENDVKHIKGAVDKLRIELSKVDSIYGVPVNQEQHKQWLEEFERIVTPDKATGARGLDEILSNDILLYKTYVIMAKFGEDKVIEIMTKGRESAKEELLKKFEITPNFTGTQARDYTSSKEPDYAEAAKLLSIPQK